MPSRKSVGDATAKAFSAIKRLLKERGITVEAVEGASQDDKELRFLQELQQVERALENPAQVENSEASNLTFGSSDSAAIGNEMVKVAKATGFSQPAAPKGAK